MKTILPIIIVTVSLFSQSLMAQITVSSNNYVGIGTSTPTQMLTINGSVKGNVNGALNINTGNGTLTLGPQNTGWCHLYTSIANGFAINAPITMIYGYPFCGYVSSQGIAYNLVFNTNNTQRMVINGPDGYVGIGTSSPSYLLDINGEINYTSQHQSSDARLKDSIKDISSPLKNLMKLKGVSYRLIPNGYQKLVASLTPKVTTLSDTANTNTKQNLATANSNASALGSVNSQSKINSQPMDTALYNRRHIGFLAQDIEKIYPQLVYKDKHGILSVDYIGLIPVLVESIKEQQTMISDLQAKVADLQKKANSQ